MEIAYTRAIVHAALGGVLDNVPTVPEPFFGLHIPITCPGVPDEVLNSRNTWSDQKAYDDQARKLAVMFQDNFTMFDASVAPEIKQAGAGFNPTGSTNPCHQHYLPRRHPSPNNRPDPWPTGGADNISEFRRLREKTSPGTV